MPENSYHKATAATARKQCAPPPPRPQTNTPTPLCATQVQIAQAHLLPRVLAEHGLGPQLVVFEQPVLEHLVSGYTREAGVRSLGRCLAAVCRHVAVNVVMAHDAAEAAEAAAAAPGGRASGGDAPPFYRSGDLRPPQAQQQLGRSAGGTAAAGAQHQQRQQHTTYPPVWDELPCAVLQPQQRGMHDSLLQAHDMAASPAAPQQQQQQQRQPAASSNAGGGSGGPDSRLWRRLAEVATGAGGGGSAGSSRQPRAPVAAGSASNAAQHVINYEGGAGGAPYPPDLLHSRAAVVVVTEELVARVRGRGFACGGLFGALLMFVWLWAREHSAREGRGARCCAACGWVHSFCMQETGVAACHPMCAHQPLWP